MTIQEAIYYIKEIRRTLDSSEFSFYAEEALDMAIEALSNTPNTFNTLKCVKLDNNSTKVDNKNDELISRRDAMDGADEIIKRDISGNNAVVEAMKAWKVYIGNLPCAQASEEYEKGWKDGQEALREEIWEYERDRLD